ncbi:HERV-H LTR-associating protein 1 [Leptonychotes weddellii]|uniref:HERV-H LTR-associating protein 1 n=1 Tax=Leptonychotes weddellii TaxID=9713 RepID=A0A2U3Z3G6_LEPWE|nr:HERV-H LTR-associating protein 1 [Leptonychotes weddellii]
MAFILYLIGHLLAAKYSGEAPGLGEERRGKGVAFLDTTELPARSVDLSALNLTELVNGMLNRAYLKDTKFFSLLSITSYSSFAFHKFSVAIYNISNLKTVDTTRFPTRYCYCLNNRTNDLSDFTALLVDVIGNSTSYLTEIFKSTSILSGTSTHGTQTPSPTKAPAPKYPQTGDLPAAWPFTPAEEPALVPGPHRVSRCPQLILEEGAITTAPLTLAIQKINPCLMELCRFFQQCLCMSRKREARTEAMRYCLEYYSWFLKNATYLCQRVKRVPHSHTLKQKCLQNICQSV